MRAILAIAVLLASTMLCAATPAPADAAPRFDGRDAEAFAASIAAIETEMGDAQKLAFRMRLAEVRNKLAEQRGHHLDDAEFAAALDGKTLADLDATADNAPVRIKIDIETSDDT